MLSRTLNRHLLSTTRRHYSTNGSGPTRSLRGRLGLGLSAGALTASLIFLAPSESQSPEAHADSPIDPNVPLSTLLRSYTVYTFCAVPALVDVAPAFLRTLLPLPVLGTITEALVRHTFFAQFVGGDTAQAALADCGKMRVGGGKGVLFAYSVEVDEDAPPPAPGSVSPHQAIVEEMIHSIDVAADFEDQLADAGPSGRRTWVAVKMTALLPDPESLIKLSSHLLRTRPASGIDFPGCANPADLDVLYSSDAKADREHPSLLTAADIKGLRELHTSLRRICTRAQQRGVRIIMDAEYTWYQPAIDALSLSLSREFNRLPPAPASATSWWPWSAVAEKGVDGSGQACGEQPLVYATYQAYLRRTPAHLLHDLALARRDGYALGVKLVRGAYHSYELAAFESATASSVPTVTTGKTPSKSIAPTAPYPPVWLEKSDSDACYNACARALVREVAAFPSSPRVSVLFGTHNWESCDAVLREMVDTGLARAEGQRVLVKAEAEGRVLFGQLYGMSDALTDSLVSRTITQAPFVLKYVPYGALQDVMPYLSRRAIENKSVLSGGAAADERRRVGRAIKARIFG